MSIVIVVRRLYNRILKRRAILLEAGPEQRNCCEISGGGAGLHWRELYEEIGAPGLLAGATPQPTAV